MANITGKYLGKLRKDTIEYIEPIIEYAYNSPSKYKSMVKAITKIYLEKYYYDDPADLTVIENYFEKSHGLDSKIKAILLATIEYHNEEKTIKLLEQNAKFYLSIALIIWISSEINKKVNPLEDKLNLKLIVKDTVELIHKVFPYTKGKDDTILKERLLEKVKDNYKINKEFFEIMSANKIYNQFCITDNENGLCEVSYKYELEGMEQFKHYEVEELMQKRGIKDKYTLISLELLTITILKQKILNKNKSYLYKIPLSFYTQSKNIGALKKITNIKSIRDNIIFLIDYEEYMANRNAIGEIKMAGFTIALDDVPAITYKNYNIFADSKIAFVSDKFLELNSGFLSVWKDKQMLLAKRKDNKQFLSEEDIIKQ